MSKQPIKMYVVRLTQEEVAAIVEALSVAISAAIRLPNSDPKEVVRMIELLRKILKQASRSEKQ